MNPRAYYYYWNTTATIVNINRANQEYQENGFLTGVESLGGSLLEGGYRVLFRGWY
jgi:hypothetical protein